VLRPSKDIFDVGPESGGAAIMSAKAMTQDRLVPSLA
jgi:hypothetical protein